MRTLNNIKWFRIVNDLTGAGQIFYWSQREVSRDAYIFIHNKMTNKKASKILRH